MGVLLKRCTYGAAVKDAKQQIITSVARFNEILRKSAKHSVNLNAKGNMRILIITQSGSSRDKETEFLTDSLFNELMKAKSFEIEIDVKSKVGIGKFKVIFWYDEKVHLGNSLGIDFVANFMEGLNFLFLSFVAVLNSIKAAAFRSQIESVVTRMQSLWEDVFKMYVGTTMTKTEQLFNLRKYEMDSIMINVFGNIIKLRKT